MMAVINERQPSKEELEDLATQEVEFDAEFEFKLNQPQKKNSMYKVLSREECMTLMKASKSEFIPTQPQPKTEYPIMSREEAERLVAEHYAYLEEKRKPKQ